MHSSLYSLTYAAQKSTKLRSIKPAGLKGEFIAYYDFQKKETTYYDKNEIPTKKFQKTMNYEPQKPDEKMIQRHKVKSVNTPAKLLNTNFTSDVNTTGTSLYSYLPDNRTKLSSSEINSAPYYSTCKLTMRFPDTPGIYHFRNRV